MKKVVFIVSTLCLILLLVACGQKDEDVLHLGLNATIVEIDASNHILYVADLGSSEVFGGRCAIDCTDLIEDEEIIYVDYETHELSIIQFSDLLVGDAVIINAYEKNLNTADDSPLIVEQIQLAAQRLEQPDKEE